MDLLNHFWDWKRAHPVSYAALELFVSAWMIVFVASDPRGRFRTVLLWVWSFFAVSDLVRLVLVSLARFN